MRSPKSALNRRIKSLLLGSLTFAAILAPLLAADGPSDKWVQEAQRRKALTEHAVWFSHEPLSYMLRRNEDYDTGELPENFAATYNYQTSAENIALLAAAGVPDGGNLHFYKGMGLVAERPEMEKTIAAAKIAHQHGMSVSVYIGGTMLVEAFDRETPEAKNWEQRDGQGRPSYYTPTQTYRRYPSMNEPAYRDYLKRVIRVAVEEVHADQIFFDNALLMQEPHSDHSPQAVQAFKEFLRRRYPTPEAAFPRFGISDASLIQAPEWDSPTTPGTLSVIDDPALQEWVRFRCETLANYCGDLYTYIKSLNPRISVGFNTHGIYPDNRIWGNGVYHPLLSGHCDFIPFDTGGYNARIDSVTGALVAQIRSYLFMRGLGIAAVENSFPGDLDTATYMAFNYQKPIPGGRTVGGPDTAWSSMVITPTFEFFRHYNDRYFTRTELVADVGVLRTFPSLAYSVSADYVPLTLAEQVLIQHHVPFDLVCDEELDHLSRYRVVVLAGQTAMSQATVDRLLSYVRAGGCLVAAPSSASLDENRRRRLHAPFAVARSEGQGRILALPAIIPGKTRQAAATEADTKEMGVRHETARLSPAQCVLPKNHLAVNEAILAGLGDRISFETGAPLTTVTEVLHRPESSETILHFINFEAHSDGGSYPVKVRSGLAGPVKSVQLFSPDHDDPIDLPFHEEDGRVSFSLPAPRLYAMVVIGQN